MQRQMYQPGFGERGWRHLGGQDEVPELYESDPWGPIDKLTPDPPNDSILSYTNKVNNKPTMTRQEELASIGRAQSGDRKAKEALLFQYRNLCHKLARKFAFTATNHDHDDLFQEGQIGLLSAIDTYNDSAGASFMTWAFYKVRGSIAGAGRVDQKQPKYPVSIETSRRAYNVEYESEPEVKDELPLGMALHLIEQCAGGIGSKRARSSLIVTVCSVILNSGTVRFVRSTTQIRMLLSLTPIISKRKCVSSFHTLLISFDETN